MIWVTGHHRSISLCFQPNDQKGENSSHLWTRSSSLLRNGPQELKHTYRLDLHVYYPEFGTFSSCLTLTTKQDRVQDMPSHRVQETQGHSAASSSAVRRPSFSGQETRRLTLPILGGETPDGANGVSKHINSCCQRIPTEKRKCLETSCEGAGYLSISRRVETLS